MTTTRSAIRIASSKSWVMKTTVFRVLPSSRRCNNSSCRATLFLVSTALKGSSISRISGDIAKARAIATRCCIPPDNCKGNLSPSPARPTISR